MVFDGGQTLVGEAIDSLNIRLRIAVGTAEVRLKRLADLSVGSVGDLDRLGAILVRLDSVNSVRDDGVGREVLSTVSQVLEAV